LFLASPTVPGSPGALVEPDAEPSVVTTVAQINNKAVIVVFDLSSQDNASFGPPSTSSTVVSCNAWASVTAAPKCDCVYEIDPRPGGVGGVATCATY
jgi:glucose dehydrogenase